MKYKCLNCNKIHEEKRIALECCYAPEQEYVCDICHYSYYNRATAQYCCAEDKVEEVEESATQGKTRKETHSKKGQRNEIHMQRMLAKTSNA
jgi:hypothetical protein